MSDGFAELARMSERLGELAKVPARAAKAASSVIALMMQEQFDQGVDPYDAPWAPLSDATISMGRSAPPLTDTSAMRDSLRVKPMAAAGVSVTIDHPAGVHQTGWNGVHGGDGPARPILPARGELPEGWIEALEAETERAYHGAMR